MPKRPAQPFPANTDKWDARFMQVAKTASGWSKDPRAKVGAVLVNKQRAIIAVSYNGFPVRIEDTEERLQDAETKLEMVIHAEQNAIIAAGANAREGTAYVVGKPVCARCAGILIQAGVTRVVAPPPAEGTDSKWDKFGRIACRMFEEAGVTFVPYSN